MLEFHGSSSRYMSLLAAELVGEQSGVIAGQST
jgi:hypothetical protein